MKSVMHGQYDTRPMITFTAAGYRCPTTGTNLYCLVTKANACEQLAKVIT